jgi:hypothetical protein
MKIYLSTLGIVLTVIGLIYLVAPSTYLGTMGVAVSAPSAMNILHAYGGCYLGFAAFLLVSTRRSGSPGVAVAASMLVMAGIVMGRIVGIAADGLPDRSIIVSTVVEIVFIVWGALTVRRAGS